VSLESGDTMVPMVHDWTGVVCGIGLAMRF
jgi:hypothetical protein